MNVAATLAEMAVLALMLSCTCKVGYADINYQTGKQRSSVLLHDIFSVHYFVCVVDRRHIKYIILTNS